jgi:hypothetical protein
MKGVWIRLLVSNALQAISVIKEGCKIMALLAQLGITVPIQHALIFKLDVLLECSAKKEANSLLNVPQEHISLICINQIATTAQ